MVAMAIIFFIVLFLVFVAGIALVISITRLVIESEKLQKDKFFNLQKELRELYTKSPDKTEIEKLLKKYTLIK